jgi:hypothetical protein
VRRGSAAVVAAHLAKKPLRLSRPLRLVSASRPSYSRDAQGLEAHGEAGGGGGGAAAGGGDSGAVNWSWGTLNPKHNRGAGLGGKVQAAPLRGVVRSKFGLCGQKSKPRRSSAAAQPWPPTPAAKHRAAGEAAQPAVAAKQATSRAASPAPLSSAHSLCGGGGEELLLLSD